MLGNIGINQKASWDENSLILNEGGCGISTGVFKPDLYNGYTISLCLSFNKLGSNTYIISQGPYNGESLYTIRVEYAWNKYNITVYIRNSSNYTEMYCKYQLETNKSYIIDLVVSSSQADLYVNGRIIHSVKYTFKLETKYRVGIGCSTNENGINNIMNDSVIKIYAMNFYDRALTLEEINKNLETYKNRFKLSV